MVLLKILVTKYITDTMESNFGKVFTVKVARSDAVAFIAPGSVVSCS